MFYDEGFDKEVNDVLQEYSKNFNDDFPLMEFEGNKKQLIKTINKCIQKKKKYLIEYAEDEED